MKSVVTISRYWNNPKIHTTVSDEDIALQIDLHDFLAALKAEIGPVAFTFKADTFSKQFDAAATKVIEGIKEESAKVM